MMTQATDVYAKGFPVGWDKEWYHGELSRVEAEQVLTASGCDCFLVRVSEGALILSLIHRGQLHHINIKYGRGWYELETGEAPYILTNLEELVSYYCNNEIKRLQVKLGAACTEATTEDISHLYESIDESPIYAKGEPEDLIKHSWYHGNITKEQADAALRESPDNGFLVMASQKNLVLSQILGGLCSHDVIHYSPKGYRLDGKEEHYESVSELITHYQHHPIEGSRVLGKAIVTVPLSVPPHLYDTIDKRANFQIYAEGEPEDLIKHSWYHGNITKEQVEAALCESPDNGFLVRVSDRNLVLSKTLGGWHSHDVIHYSPKGYRLDGKDEQYDSVSELITHYQHHPIEGSRVLGTAIATVPSVRELEEALVYEAILFRKENTKLNIQWKKTSDLPVAISAPQVVKIGDSVYVGGGMRRSNHNTIYEFNKSQKTWTALPPCPTTQHALTTLNSELRAIGGRVNSKSVGTAYTFRRGKWINVLPSMLTPRYCLTAMSYNDTFIIAAGGETLRTSTGESELTNAVEIYSVVYHTWYSTDPLPFPIYGFSMRIIDRTCYILGGSGHEDDGSLVLYSKAPRFLKNGGVVQQDMLSWKQFKGTYPLCLSASLELNGRLVALGGSEHPIHLCGTKFVSVYNFASDTWMECKGAQLPVPLYRAGVVKLDSDEIIVVGGQTRMQEFSATVCIGRYQISTSLNQA